MFALTTLLALVPIAPAQNDVKDKKDERPLPIQALKPRLVGPAVTSGRVVGFAVHPTDRSHYFVAVASGGVWKTTNAGTTWTPVFDNEGSYSIGCVVLDPKNPNVVWVGTGENNSQRSVAYGDGVYKCTDGGKTWKNVGLKTSEHIGKILIDPRDSDTVYVAAQGRCGRRAAIAGSTRPPTAARRGTRSSTSTSNTGVTDVVQDPRNPDVLVAASYQRRRHVWTIINGGPARAIHRTHRRRQDVEEDHERASRPATSAASAWRSRRPIPTRSTPSSRPPTTRAASSAAPTAASPGRSATRSRSRRSTTRTSSSIPRTRTAST